MSRDRLYFEERVHVVYDMLNRSVDLYDGLGLSGAARQRLDDFTRRAMLVLIGQRTAVPRRLRSCLRRPAR